MDNKDVNYYIGETLRFCLFGLIIAAILVVMLGTCIGG
jgi:hypothetical protein